MSTSEPETLRPPIAVVAWALAVAAVAVPALCRLPGLPSVESSDRALFELRTRDVFSLDPPLVGAYSRYGWNHPGPVFQYLFAIPYRLFGGDATAIRLTAVLCTVGMMTWIATLLRRRGRIANVGVATAVVGLVAMRGDLLALDTWNPTLAVLPVLVALVAAWMTLERPTAGRLGSVLAADPCRPGPLRHGHRAAPSRCACRRRRRAGVVARWPPAARPGSSLVGGGADGRLATGGGGHPRPLAGEPGRRRPVGTAR